MKHCRSVLLMVVTLLLCVTIPGFATSVEGIQFYLLGDGAFVSSPSPGKFSLSESPMDPDFISGRILLAGGAWENYEIRTASINITPSNLLSDQSYTVGGYTNPKIAKGNFAGGATFTITGAITTQGGAVEVFPYGTILEGTVTTDFWATERTGIPANFINIQQTLAVTGGELKTGAVTGFVIRPTAVADITLYFCSQVGNVGLAVEDFQSDINYIQPSIVQISSPIPEPVSMFLFAIGGIFAMRKTR